MPTAPNLVWLAGEAHHRVRDFVEQVYLLTFFQL